MGRLIGNDAAGLRGDVATPYPRRILVGAPGPSLECSRTGQRDDSDHRLRPLGIRPWTDLGGKFAPAKFAVRGGSRK